MISERWLNAGIFLAVPGFALLAWALGETFLITLATKAVILGLAGVGLNLALGLGGLVSLGHAAFFGIGGYAVGILAHHAQTYQPMILGPWEIAGTTSMPVLWVVAVVAAALAALVIGALALRTRGVYFIMVTLAFGQMFYYFAISWPDYGGEDGLPIYLRNDFPGLNTLDPVQFFALCFAALTGALWISAKVAAAPFGLALTAARQSETRVETVGITPYRLRLLAFTLSGAITGFAGALFADLNRFVSPVMFDWHTSGELIVFVLLGGVGRLYGPVVGAALFVGAEHVLGDVWDFWQMLLGFVLLAVVLFARGGLIGALAGSVRSHG